MTPARTATEAEPAETLLQVTEAAPAEAPLPPLKTVQRARLLHQALRAPRAALVLGQPPRGAAVLHGSHHRDGRVVVGGFTLSLLPFGLNSWTVLLFPPAGHLWTISTMTFFYLLFPTIATHLNRVHPKQVRSFACALYGIQLVLFIFMLIGASIFMGELGYWLPSTAGVVEGQGYWWARAWPPIRLPTFVMGMLAARQAELEAKDPALSQNCGSADKACGPHYATALLLVWLLIVALGILEQLFLTSAGLGWFCRVFGEALLPILFYELVVALVPGERGEAAVDDARLPRLEAAAPLRRHQPRRVRRPPDAHRLHDARRLRRAVAGRVRHRRRAHPDAEVGRRRHAAPLDRPRVAAHLRLRAADEPRDSAV